MSIQRAVSSFEDLGFTRRDEESPAEYLSRAVDHAVESGVAVEVAARGVRQMLRTGNLRNRASQELIEPFEREFHRQVTVPMFEEHFGSKGILRSEQEVGLAKLIEAAAIAEQHLIDGDSELSDSELRAVVRLGHMASERFVTANVGLARKAAVVARNSYRGDIEFEELVQEATFVIHKLVHEWDYMVGAKFSSFAYARIVRTLQRHIVDKGRTVRVPQGVVTQSRTWRSAVANFYAQHGRYGSVEEIAEYGSVEPPRAGMYDVMRPIASLDEQFLDDDNVTTLYDVVPHESLEQIPHSASELLLQILQANLTPHLYEVVTLYYGLAGSRMSKVAIAEQRGVTVSAVDKSLERARARLRLCAELEDLVG